MNYPAPNPNTSPSTETLPQHRVDRYRRIVDESTEIIYRTSPSGHFTFVNPTAARIVQRSVDECLGVHFLSLIRADFRAAASAFYREQVKNRVPLTYFEFPAVAADGSEVWVGQNVQLVIEDGEIVELQGLGRDITARKKVEQKLLASELRYRVLFEANPHPMWVYDTESLSILTVNNAAIQGYGYSEAEFLAMTVRDVQPPRLNPENDISAKSVVLQKHVKKDGSIIDVEVTSLPILFSDRRAELLTATDVTARLRAEAENVRLLEAEREKEEQLRQAQKMEAIGKLAGGIAHDFNNLLTAITGYSEMSLRRLDPGDQVHRNLTEIQHASARATSLTRQLLAFSRKQILQARVFDLNGVVTEMEKLLRRLIGENIELKTVLESDLGYINADPGQIEQVLMNLVVNARDASADYGEITIETANVDLEDGSRPYVLLSVSDHGTGMDEVTRKRIFDPFFTTKEPGKGTGLGLSTVYGVVEQSNGKIEVISEVGKGSKFMIYLPRVEQDQTPKREVLNELPPCGNETILIAEDEPMVRTMTRKILELSGYQVLEAESGLAAVELSKSHDGPVHLLLTDVVMPQMSGPRLSEEIGSLRPEVKTLFMSGYTDSAIVHHGVLQEGMPFLQKPFTPDALVRKVRRVLDARTPAGELNESTDSGRRSSIDARARH
jgi:two-component system cell cycle sensor histidine kinase/response regulator CckA